MGVFALTPIKLVQACSRRLASLVRDRFGKRTAARSAARSSGLRPCGAARARLRAQDVATREFFLPQSFSARCQRDGEDVGTQTLVLDEEGVRVGEETTLAFRAIEHLRIASATSIAFQTARYTFCAAELTEAQCCALQRELFFSRIVGGTVLFRLACAVEFAVPGTDARSSLTSAAIVKVIKYAGCDTYSMTIKCDKDDCNTAAPARPENWALDSSRLCWFELTEQCKVNTVEEDQVVLTVTSTFYFEKYTPILMLRFANFGCDFDLVEFGLSLKVLGLK